MLYAIREVGNIKMYKKIKRTGINKKVEGAQCENQIGGGQYQFNSILWKKELD